MKGKHHIRKDLGEDDEAIDYFNRILPRIKEEIGPEKVSELQYYRLSRLICCEHSVYLQVKEMIEFTQYPGETIFVPGGW